MFYFRQWFPFYGSEGSSQVTVQAIGFCSKIARTGGPEVARNMCNL